MESVYIETSVVSYLVARPGREPVTAWRQQLTNEWWVERRGLHLPRVCTPEELMGI
jgi:hypothetical protein